MTVRYDELVAVFEKRPKLAILHVYEILEIIRSEEL